MKKDLIEGLACNIESRTVVADSITVQFIKRIKHSFSDDVQKRTKTYAEIKKNSHSF